MEDSQFTKEMVVKLIIENQLKDFDKHDHAERLKIAKRKGAAGNPLFIVFNNTSIEFTLDELKVLVPLERDRMNYLKLAKNLHGLLSIPKQKGRRNHHMSQRHQALKSESLRVFRSLLETHVDKFKAVCVEKGLEYTGIPDSAIPEVGKQAARIAIRNVNEAQFRKRTKARRRQEHSRKVNAGLLSISTSEKNYVNRGGQYGK